MSSQLHKTVKNIIKHTQIFANIINDELVNSGFAKNLPIDLVLDMVNSTMKQEIGSLSLSLSKQVPDPKSTIIAKTSVTLPASNKGECITLQLKTLC
ncbi:MAG: hypothetical protein PHZ11_07155 [Desulfitobacteriaceae bacterium]|nr:hypothetical protein [Clostridia bacterium]MDD4346647.1 hypothetical protein [Desulfitobacteriaceae bacterium]